MARMNVVVIGAGMAGMSCAAELAQQCDVTVLEAEDAPGYHSSGRSAAAYIEPYVNGTIFTLTASSRAFFEQPPAGFADAPLVTPRADVMIARESKSHLVDAYLQRWRPFCPGLVEIPAANVREQVPILRHETVARAVADPNVMDIDAHGLLNGFRRVLKARGGTLVTRSRVESLDRANGGWRLEAGGREYDCDAVVNAAGAWGDEVAEWQEWRASGWCRNGAPRAHPMWQSRRFALADGSRDRERVLFQTRCGATAAVARRSDAQRAV